MAHVKVQEKMAGTAMAAGVMAPVAGAMAAAVANPGAMVAQMHGHLAQSATQKDGSNPLKGHQEALAAPIAPQTEAMLARKAVATAALAVTVRHVKPPPAPRH
jgi:hypothetical protein